MNNLIVIFEDVKFMEFYSKKKIEKASLQVKKYFFQHANDILYTLVLSMLVVLIVKISKS